MPTVLLVKGFRFFFYSNENNEPEHVHVRKGSAEGKYGYLPDCMSLIGTDLLAANKEKF